jgi:acetoin utilization deacetylase AcuC-like enzyme
MPERRNSDSQQGKSAAPRVGFVYHPACLEHNNGPSHPERPQRISAVHQRVTASGLLDRLVQVPPEPCPVERLEQVHERSYVAALREACRQAPTWLDPDTGVSAGSWDAALLSAGGAVAACDAVMSGKVGAAFVATRPPGHHAEAGQAMGFCLLNNVAVAARYLQDTHGIGRVAIIDWDVHHGNGTQHLFEENGDIFYFSVHQFPFYPGTGDRRERGRGKGTGSTLNVPLPAGCGDDEYRKVFREILRPAIDEFRPEGILISAGFDAHRDDPLAGMRVTEDGYVDLTRIVQSIADEHCGGRLVSLLEGGYDLKGLAASVEAHLEALIDARGGDAASSDR